MQRQPHYRIDPFDLRLFAAVAEGGTITAGARTVHLSLAAASTRLQALEHALGTPLMLRAKTGVQLTDAGHTLLRHATRLQRDLEALHADMAAHAHGMRSTVRLLCNTAAASEHLPPRLGPFLATHPQLDVELRELESVDVLQAMRLHKADLGIVASHVAADGLVTHPFTTDRLVAVLPTAWVRRLGWAGRRGIAFAPLLEQPFVGLPPDAGLSRFLQGRALQQGRGLSHRVQVPGFDALLRLVADGVGVAVVPALAAERLAQPGVTVRPLAEPWATRQLRICASATEPLTPAAAALLQALMLRSPGASSG